MTTREWAKKEIEIACKSSVVDNASDDWNEYIESCYKSALKAYESLCEDGHSGTSFSITKEILTRLMNGLPLTPIKESDFDNANEMYDEVYYKENSRNVISEKQCPRMSSLFKTVYKSGEIEYTDVDRFICIDMHTKSTYTSGLVSDILKKLYPINVPFFPKSNEKYYVYCEDFLYDESNGGDFDTKGIFYVKCPDGTKMPINRYFAFDKNTEREIDEYEYSKRFVKAYVAGRTIK